MEGTDLVKRVPDSNEGECTEEEEPEEMSRVCPRVGNAVGDVGSRGEDCAEEDVDALASDPCL